MSHDWLRLWHDMPTDPKFRVIAKKSGRPLSEVLAVFVLMLTEASKNEAERGSLANWQDDDAAAGLDMDPEHVSAIRTAMQGKTLAGNKLAGWENRQPKREDSSTERVRAFRAKRNEEKRDETPCNATKRTETLDKIRLDEIREEIDTAQHSEQEPARAREPAAALQSEIDLDDLNRRMIDACNGSLDNPVNCLGLLSMATPQMWIREGADIELDVLPTLAAAGKRYHGKRIRDWSYFTGMIAEAKAKRTAPMPEVAASQQRAPPPNSRLARSLEFRALLNVSKPEQVTP